MEVLPHETELIATIAVGLSAAFVGGLIAHRFRLPTLIGYCLLAWPLAHSPPASWPIPTWRHNSPRSASFCSCLGSATISRSAICWRCVASHYLEPSVRSPFATALGFALTRLWGWDVGAGLVFGLALSVASTVVLLRGSGGAGSARGGTRPSRGRLVGGRGSDHGRGPGAPASARAVPAADDASDGRQLGSCPLEHHPGHLRSRWRCSSD